MLGEIEINIGVVGDGIGINRVNITITSTPIASNS